jgi:hypothetical protein
MPKTVTVKDLAGAAEQAIEEAGSEPVLVRKDGRPAAWLLSAPRLAEVAAARGADAGAMYEQALDLLAVELYRQAVISLEQGATLAGIALHDFIDLCSRLNVPILWEPPGGIRAEVDRLDEFLKQGRPSD